MLFVDQAHTRDATEYGADDHKGQASPMLSDRFERGLVDDDGAYKPADEADGRNPHENCTEQNEAFDDILEDLHASIIA